MPETQPSPSTPPVLCTCGEAERPDDRTVIAPGQDGATHRFNGLPCFVDAPTPITGLVVDPTGVWEETPGVWNAMVDGVLVAVGPDEQIVRAVYEDYVKNPSTPATPQTGQTSASREALPDIADLTRRLPHLLTDQDTGASYTLSGTGSGGVLWECRVAGCGASREFDNADVGFRTIRQHNAERHPAVRPEMLERQEEIERLRAKPCDLGDCNQIVEGTVTINVPSIGEEPVQRTLGICGSHLRLIDGGQVVGFSFVPEYRS